MTKQLEEALAAVSQLPEKEQDVIAAMILEKVAEKKAIALSAISPSDIETLERLYTLRDKPEIVQFINQHPFLLPVLLEAPDKIRIHFPDSPLFLQVDRDPENSNDVDLVVSILIDLDPDDAVYRLNQLDKDSRVDLPYEVRKLFITTLEYSDELWMAAVS